MNKFHGWAQSGGSLSTSGVLSSDEALKVYPQSTLTVYRTDTLTLETIYSDDGVTPKANPFTVNDDGSYLFWCDSATVDVRASGTGVSSPFTETVSTLTVFDPDDPRIPTQSEKDALAGTSGSPSNTNRYVTSADPRLLKGSFTRSSLPSSGIQAGTLAYVTDELRGLYRYTGSVWTSVSGVANVVDFGADPTGVASSTSAINNAISAVSGLYGGTVYFPNGRYKITGTPGGSTNSVLTYPVVRQSEAATRTIRLLGETYGLFSIAGQSPAAVQGVVIDATAVLAGSGSQPAILAPKAYSDTEPGFALTDFSAINPVFENLVFEVAANPPNTVLQLHNVPKVTLRNVTITTTDTGLSATQPTHTSQVGIYLPAVANNSAIITDNVVVYGQYFGVGFSEHWEPRNTQINLCAIALLAQGQYQGNPGHASTGKIEVLYCPVLIDFSSANHYTQVRFNLGVEKAAAGPWYAPATYDIIDPNNKGVGELIFNDAYTGATPATYLTKQGGANLNARSLYSLGNPATTTLLTAPQSIPNGTQTALSWPQASYNLEGVTNSGTPTRLTFKTPGPRLISVQVGWASNATGNRSVEIRQDGATYINPALVQAAVNGAETGQSKTFIVNPTTAGTYIEIMVSQSSGGSLNVANARIDIVRQ